MTHEFLWIVRLVEFWDLRRSAELLVGWSFELVWNWENVRKKSDERVSINHRITNFTQRSTGTFLPIEEQTNRFGNFNQIFFTTVTEVWVFCTRLHDREISKFCSTRVKSSLHDTKTLCRITKLVHTIQRPNFECQNGWLLRRWLQVHHVTCSLTSSLLGNVQLELVSP